MSTAPVRSTVTETEKSRARAYAESTREQLKQSVAALSDSGWRFKPKGQAWSIADIVEHVVIIEKAVHGIVSRMPQCAEDDAARDVAAMDALVFAGLEDRANKLQAPPIVQPTGAVSPEEALRNFEQARARSIELIDAGCDLRGRVYPHPFFGPFDGFQWLVGASGHSARHALQISELRSRPDFPQ